MRKHFSSSNTKLSPQLSNQFIGGTLDRIKVAHPVYHQHILREIKRRGFGARAVAQHQPLSGIFDSLASIGDKFGSILSAAAETVGKVYVDKEQSKAAVAVAQAQADAQLRAMNAQLAAQQSQARTKQHGT